jgi:hypothetical protein
MQHFINYHLYMYALERITGDKLHLIVGKLLYFFSLYSIYENKIYELTTFFANKNVLCGKTIFQIETWLFFIFSYVLLLILLSLSKNSW